MHRVICASVLMMFVAGIFGGCESGRNRPTAVSLTKESGHIADGNTCVMQYAGVDVLRLSTPTDTTVVPGDGSLHFKGPVLFDEVEIWLIAGAKSVDEGLQLVDSQIVSEFKDFKPDHVTDLTIAGSPAKRLVGPGHEADDGDSGAADVIVFKVGNHVFVACTHGETLEPAGEQWMFTLVQSARTP